MGGREIADLGGGSGGRELADGREIADLERISRGREIADLGGGSGGLETADLSGGSGGREIADLGGASGSESMLIWEKRVAGWDNVDLARFAYCEQSRHLHSFLVEAFHVIALSRVSCAHLRWAFAHI